MKDYQEDLFRIFGDISLKHFLKALTWSHYLFLFSWRKIKAGSKLAPLYRIIARWAKNKNGIEIPYTVEIGRGFLLQHPYGITVNSQSIVGSNVTIYKGATIGNIKMGKKKGTPVIGDNVYIGLNSTVVGGIKIGSDVLIAPNTYVNFDVPEHSIVIGSPGVIHQSINATEGYINNPVSTVNKVNSDD